MSNDANSVKDAPSGSFNYMLALTEATMRTQETQQKQQIADAQTTILDVKLQGQVVDYWNAELEKDAKAVTDASHGKYPGVSDKSSSSSESSGWSDFWGALFGGMPAPWDNGKSTTADAEKKGSDNSIDTSQEAQEAMTAAQVAYNKSSAKSQALQSRADSTTQAQQGQTTIDANNLQQMTQVLTAVTGISASVANFLSNPY